MPVAILDSLGYETTGGLPVDGLLPEFIIDRYAGDKSHCFANVLNDMPCELTYSEINSLSNNLIAPLMSFSVLYNNLTVLSSLLNILNV